MTRTSFTRGALCGRLASHFALAAAAAVGAASSDADAQIVHWANANISVPATQGGVYINVETRATGSTKAAVPGWDINPYSATALNWFSPSTGDGGLGNAMMRFPGVTAGPAGSLAVNTVVGVSGSYSGSGNVIVGSAPGNWQLNSSNYFGFRFKAADGGTKYGWGRFVIGSAINGSDRMIAEIAYESSGAPINVGATVSTSSPDSDSDGIPDASDNCPSVANANQANIDGDAYGDVCDSDRDGDGIANGSDNCPDNSNANQANIDSDAYGDVCDSDRDGDGVANGSDNCPNVPSANQADSDSDGVGNICDNCPSVANTDQTNFDGDAYGDACDGDSCPDNPFATAPISWYRDADGDLFGSPTVIIISCSQPSGYIPKINTDCNDSNAAINPAAQEVCDAGNVDEDCDNVADNADPSALAAGKSTFYVDADDDNFGTGSALQFCDEPALHAPVAGDCNDANPAVRPGATEVCDLIDNNCNNQVNEGLTFSLWYADGDSDNYGAGDGYSWCAAPAGYPRSVAGDCNDSNPAIRPGATEVCDLVDNNCNGQVNEGLTFSLWYADGDSDNYGGGDGYSWCAAPAGRPRSVGGDCNDANAAINPGAAEVCDGVNNNCAGGTDEGFPNFDSDAYADCVDGDIDNDGSLNAADCNDFAADTYPNAPELCSNINVDNDCDNNAGEAEDGRQFFRDNDGDGFGAGTEFQMGCTALPGWGLTDQDCNDANAAINPGRTDAIGNGIDDNCDGYELCWLDADSDGFLPDSPVTTVLSVDRDCLDPTELGNTAPQGDCGPTDGAIYPGAPETCANLGTNNDCDGYNDAAEASDSQTFFTDSDNDGYGTGAAFKACEAATGRASVAGDCNDSNPAIRPGATEVCDLVDNNCNSQVNEGLTFSLWYADGDSDNYGAGDGYSWCAAPAGRPRSVGGDCNDANAAINPGAAEVCDGVNNNCAGGTDEGFPNFDSDAYADCVDGDIDNDGSPNADDCNDFAADIYPNAPELCANIGIDNDCDDNDNDATDFVALWIDADSDGYGQRGTTSTKGCVTANRSTNSLDCNDANAAIRPGAAEVCDGIDNDCDDLTDDYDSGVTGRPTWFRDQDNDTYGDPAQTLQRCVQPANYVGNSGDGCPEVTSLQAPRTWFRDQDNDTYGDPAITQSACSAPAGFVGNSGDGCPTVGTLQAPRLWYRDQDIDGQGDPNTTELRCEASAGYVGNNTDLCPQTQNVFAPLTFYRDQDGDGFGDLYQTESACSAPTGFVGNSGDGCPDVYALQAPRTWFRDQDNDGYGDASQTQSACTVPSGFVGNSGDACPSQGSLQAPVSYFIDSDRDGYGSSTTALLCATPAPDGYSTRSGDCNDAVPGLVTARRYYADTDGDGAGDPASFVDVCQLAPPAGYVTNANDLCAGDVYKTAPGVCGCGVSDADSDGDGVSDCNDTTPALRLVPQSGGSFIGSNIVVDVTVSGQVEASVGAQLALNYDTSRLAFVSMVPGGGAVFAREIIEVVNASSGTILYAVGENTAGGGSTAAATVATITFRLADGVEEVCGVQNLVAFGSVAGSSSRLASVTGSVITPTPINLGAITASSAPMGLIDVPASWSRPADAGVNGSRFDEPSVTANAPCGMDPAVTIAVTYPAGHTPATGTSWPSGGVFPVGTTSVTWTAQTGSGTTFTETRTFTVLNHALMNMTVSFPGVMASSHQRTVEVRIGSGAWTGTVMTIAPHGSGTGSQGRGTASVEVPVGTTATTCVLVRDPSHSVVDAGTLAASGSTWTTAVTLVQGDINTDNRVDILDFANFLLEQVAGSSVAPDASSNFNGDTVINNIDFSFISSGFFTIGDTCGGGVAGDDALDRISVAELRKRGEGELASSDLNRDGWVDIDDMALWMQGVRPQLEAGSAQASGSAAE